MLYYVNEDSGAVSFKKNCGCGSDCSHLQCKMSVCERARAMADGGFNFLMNTKKQVLSLLYVGNYADAIELATVLLDSGQVDFERFESFRLQYFSCQL